MTYEDVIPGSVWCWRDRFYFLILDKESFLTLADFSNPVIDGRVYSIFMEQFEKLIWLQESYLIMTAK